MLACLTLVAPSGMTTEDRNAWVQVARQTLKGMPADLLKMGCAEARKRCRFASEIVPTIFECVEADWNRRRRIAADHAARRAPRLPEPERWVPEPGELRRIMREVAEAARGDPQ